MKKVAFYILVVLLISGGGFLWYRTRKAPSKNPTQQENSQPPSQTSPSPSSKGKKTLLDWLKNATGVECQLQQDGNKITVLSKGEKIRVFGEEISLGSQRKKGNFINDGQWVYIWTDEDQQGIKYPVPEEENSDQSDQSTEVLSLEEAMKEWENYQYSCHPKQVSDQDFVPPAEIEFVDLSRFMDTSN